jgi:hypothetical protein
MKRIIRALARMLIALIGQLRLSGAHTTPLTLFRFDISGRLRTDGFVGCRSAAPEASGKTVVT